MQKNGAHIREDFDTLVAEAVRRNLSYYAVEYVAEGGFGIVYHVENTFGDHASLKLHTIPKTENPKVAVRIQTRGKKNIVIQNERNAAHLKHPNHWSYYRIGTLNIEDKEVFYVLGEWLPHGTLEQRLQSGPLSLPEFYTNARQITDAIAHMHAGGIGHTGFVHLDIKPDNVMFLRPNHPVIIDYSNSEATDRNGVVIKSGAAMPSKKYCPPELTRYNPEHALPAKVMNYRIDVWMLGALFFEMLTGKNLNISERDNVADVLAQHYVPKQLIVRIERCLAEAPHDRYANAGIVSKELEKAQYYRRRKVYAVGAGVATLGLLGFIGFANHNVRLVVATSYVNACKVHLNADEPVAAEVACDNAIAWYGAYPEAHLHRGHALLQQGKIDAAQEAYRKAAELSGEKIHETRLIAEAEEETHTPPQTAREINELDDIITQNEAEIPAVSHVPHDTHNTTKPPQTGIEARLVDAQRSEEAVTKEPQIIPEPIQEEQTPLDIVYKTIEQYRNLIKIDPKVSDVSVKKEAYRNALELDANGEIERAIAAYDIAVTYGHDKKETYRKLTDFYEQHEAWADVERIAELAIYYWDNDSTNSRNKKSRQRDVAEFLLIASCAELKQGKCEEALENYQRAVYYWADQPLREPCVTAIKEQCFTTK